LRENIFFFLFKTQMPIPAKSFDKTANPVRYNASAVRPKNGIRGWAKGGDLSPPVRMGRKVLSLKLL
jgi:hypothetical protein